MKKIIVFLLIIITTTNGFAQSDSEASNGGFKKENLFTGGNVTVSFFNGGTILGMSPHFGYSITKWLDAATIVGYTYTGQRDEFNNKLRQTIIAPGAFVRIFPVPFLFAKAQYERNFIRLKGLPSGGGSVIQKTQVNSFLVGAGYTSGRAPGNNNFYYVSIMFDVLKDINSPYTDSYGRILPIMSAGLNIALFQGNRNRRGR
jgi:hypothetical protein